MDKTIQRICELKRKGEERTAEEAQEMWRLIKETGWAEEIDLGEDGEGTADEP